MKLEKIEEISAIYKLPDYNEQNWLFNIGFFELFKNFKFIFLVDFFSSIFYSNLETSLEKYFVEVSQGRISIFFYLILYLLKDIFGYFKSFTQSSLQNKSYYFIKNKSLEKFSTLRLEDKIVKKPDLSILIEEEIDIVAEWAHLPIHVADDIISMVNVIFLYKKTIVELGKRIVIISLSFVLILSFFEIYFINKVNKEIDEARKDLKEEIDLTEDEKNKSILIDSMGLNRSYLNKRKLLENNIIRKIDGIYKIEFLSKHFLSSLSTIYVFCFIAFLRRVSFSNWKSFVYFFQLFNNIHSKISSLLNAYREIKLYLISLKNLNKFFSLDSKNENILGVKLSSENIRSIELEDIDFGYEKSKKDEMPFIKNYSKFFTVSSNLEENRIIGKNGIGKSTIMFLILGLLEPKKGRIIINLKNGKKFNLNKEVNLIDWREKVVAYSSHDNLIPQDKGSTGQRQKKNIKEILEKRENSSQVFMFDEATNSLDNDNRNIIYYIFSFSLIFIFNIFYFN